MNAQFRIFILALGILLAGGLAMFFYVMEVENFEEVVEVQEDNTYYDGEVVPLPDVRFDSEKSVEEALNNRRTVRNFTDEEVTLADVGQLLWSAQGITDLSSGFRTAPSAGGKFPLEVYLVAGKVKNLAPAVYHYNPKIHQLEKVVDGDKRAEVSVAGVNQKWIAESAVNIVFAGVFERTRSKYGERAEQYVYIEVGHAAQNIYLQAESLGLGVGVIGAFDDSELKRIMGMKEEEAPLYIITAGNKF